MQLANPRRVVCLTLAALFVSSHSMWVGTAYGQRTFGRGDREVERPVKVPLSRDQLIVMTYPVAKPQQNSNNIDLTSAGLDRLMFGIAYIMAVYKQPDAGAVRTITERYQETKAAPEQKSFADEVKQAIVTLVQPDTWKDNNKSGKGEIVVVSGALVVKNTIEVHRQLQFVISPVTAPSRAGASSYDSPIMGPPPYSLWLDQIESGFPAPAPSESDDLAPAPAPAPAPARKTPQAES